MEIMIAALVGALVLWWLFGRVFKTKRLRQGTRLMLIIALLVGGVGLISMPETATSQEMGVITPVDEGGNPLLPVEIAQVQLGTLPVAVSATGQLYPARQSVLFLDFSAPITTMYALVGQPVRSGDILAQVETTELENALRSAQSTLTEAQATLAALVAPPMPIDIAIAEAEVAAANASLYAASQTAPTGNDDAIAALQIQIAQNQLWQQQLQRDLSGQSPGLWINGNNAGTVAGLNGADNNIDIAQTNYADTLNTTANASAVASAVARLAQAEQTLERLLAGPTDERRRRAEIDVETAQLAVEQAQERIDQATLRAPFDGIVAQVNLIIGQTSTRDRTITIFDPRLYNLDLTVNEVDVIAIEEGQTVDLRLDALPEAPLSGRVALVSRVPTAQGAAGSGNLRVNYTVRVEFEPGSIPVRPGMSLTGSIVQSEREDVLIVPNRFIQTDPETQEVFVLIPAGENAYQRVPITTGARNRDTTEVTSGISVGQMLVILPELPPEQAPLAF